MNIKAYKRFGLSIALALAILGAAGGSSVFAQDWRWSNSNSDIRMESRRKQMVDRGNYDGRIAGERDAKARLRYHPAGSIRYQRGGVDYRSGFEDGYDYAYRIYAGAYVNRFNNSYGVREVNQNYLGRPDGYYDRSGRFHRY
jgi:hypothetical protein